MNDISGKSIFTTGGNAGIGLATALMFAKAGCNVAIFSRREATNAEAKAQIEALGPRCLTFAGDVLDEAALRNALSATFDAFGSLDFAFNNAGIEQVGAPLVDQTDADYQRIMDVNVKGVWLCMKHQVPLMKRSGGGSIVNTSSVAGMIALPQIPLYVAAKHAVIGLTKATALEFATEGIRVNAICPGAVRTDLYGRFTQNDPAIMDMIESNHPMGRSGTPEECASAVLYLCRDATWTTGSSVVMDGGLTVK